MAWTAQSVVTATVITAAWGNQVQTNLDLTSAAVVTTAGDVVYASAANTMARLAATAYALLKWTAAGTALEAGQRLGKGANVTAAGTIAVADGHYAHVVGTTTINYITSTGWPAGGVLILKFDEAVTVTHAAGGGAANSISLSVAGNFSATANDVLMLVFDGTIWREVARTVV